jgi:hypothetical protein
MRKNDSRRYREGNHRGKNRLYGDGEQMLKQKTQRRPEVEQLLIECRFSARS